ncbi:MAG TPA: tetratricopeptide repeat protein [Allosphingosinicella sp.]|nr:tetratricopeptide repeat protein [Allosphingosinicella sp.]
MKQIRAFVGHSFTEGDEAVVGIFLSYFDQMKAVLPTFDWVHARAAEPTELAKKVLSLVEDRNVFIGICTKKERVTANENAHPSVWDRGKRVVRDIDLQWKTSDWIIQEIGLAVGRKMQVILLLENGCRKPGGLQGDIEFIPFERAYPEKAFGRLLEMTRALSLPSSAEEATSPEAQQKAASEEDQPRSIPDGDVPDGSWDVARYENAYAWRLIVDEDDAAQQIDEAYRRTKEASDPLKLARWDSMKEVWRLRTDKGGSVSRLRSLREAHPQDVQILLTLVEGLVVLGLSSEAAEGYLRAAELTAADVVESERLRGLAAVQMRKAGQREKSDEMMKSQRARMLDADKKEQLNYLYRMKDLVSDFDGKYSEIEILERIVDLQPDDWDSRFSLAYRYSQIEVHDISLYHYTQIPSGERSSAAWNNLGVCFQRLGMPAKSVDSYRMAATKGETLAMSNLAYKFMGAGFAEEAGEELKKALEIENFHWNVGEAISALKDIPDEEGKKLEAAIKATESRREFFRGLGQAITHPDIEALPKRWVGPDCTLSISIEGDVFHATGEYERSANALASSLGVEAKPVRYTVEYNGKIVGRRVLGSLKTKSDGRRLSSGLLSLTDADTDIEFAMVIGSKEAVISVAERQSSASPKFYKLTAAEAA